MSAIEDLACEGWRNSGSSVLLTQSGPRYGCQIALQQRTELLLDYLVGAGLQPHRHGEAKRLGGLEVVGALPKTPKIFTPPAIGSPFHNRGKWSRAPASEGLACRLLLLDDLGILVDEAGRLVSLIGLLFAAIQRHARALIDNLAVLNKNRVLLRRVVGMDSETSDPCRALQLICRKSVRNFRPDCRVF